MNKIKKALIIDGNNLLFRAYYATSFKYIKSSNSFKEIPTNAVYIFIRMLINYLKNNYYNNIFIAFDSNKKTFRHEILSTYKKKEKKPHLN